MLVLIHPASNEVLVDGEARNVDCSALLPDIINVVYDTARGNGIIQRTDGDAPIGARIFGQVFNRYFQSWKAAGFIDARTLAERRTSVIEEIKGYRNQRSNAGGYLVSGKWFHSDQPSRTQQMALVMLGASVPAGLQWKTMDSSFVTMTPALASAIFAAAVAHDVATFAVAETHIAAVNGHVNPETYNFKSGWPAVFGE